MFLTYLLVKNCFVSSNGILPQRRTMKGLHGLTGLKSSRRPDSSNIHGFPQPKLETSESAAGAGGTESIHGQTDLFTPLSLERVAGSTESIQDSVKSFASLYPKYGEASVARRMNSSSVSLSPSGTGTVTMTVSPREVEPTVGLVDLPVPSVFTSTPGYSLHADVLTRKLESVNFEQGREALMSTVVSMNSVVSTIRPKVYELSTIFTPWLGELIDVGTEVGPLQQTQRLVLPELPELPELGTQPTLANFNVDFVPRHLERFSEVPPNFLDPLEHIETLPVPTVGVKHEFMLNSLLVNTFDGVPHLSNLSKPDFDLGPAKEQQQGYVAMVQQQKDTDAALAAKANDLLNELANNAAKANAHLKALEQLAADEKTERDLGGPFSFQRLFKYFTGYTLDPEKVQTYGRIAGVTVGTVGIVVMVGGYFMYNRLPSVGTVSWLMRRLASMDTKNVVSGAFATATTTVGKALETAVAQSNWEETLGTVRTKATEMTTLAMAKFTSVGQAYFEAKAKRKASMLMTKSNVYNFMKGVLGTTLKKVWDSK